MANVIWNPGINAYNPTLELIVNQQSQSIDGNYSVLSWSLVLHRPSSISSSSSKSYNVKINNVTVASGTTTIGGSGDKTIASGTSTVYHNSDGTKTGVPFSFYMDIGISWSGSSTGNASESGTMDLTTIPRATQPTLSASSTAIASAVTINTPRASGSFSHILKYSFGSASGTIATGVGTSYAWTLPWTLANQIPNATSGVGTITCETYNGSTLIGTKTVQFTATVPAGVVPTVSISTSGVGLYQSQYVQGKSKVAVTLNEAGAYGSTIKSRSTTVKSGTNIISSSAAASFTSGFLNYSGTITIATTVTDSRGRTATASTTISVVAYSAPKITAFTAFRANADGSVNPQGAYIKMTGSSSISPINNTNTRTTRLQYRLKGATTWTYAVTHSSSYTPTITATVAADVNSSYEVQLVVGDYYNSSAAATSQTINIGTAFVLMDFHKDGYGLAIGKVSEYGMFEVGVSALFYNGLTVKNRYAEQIGSTNTNLIEGEWTIIGDGANCPPTTKNKYFYLQTIKANIPDFNYPTKQIAYGYVHHEMWVRHQYTGTWSQWINVTGDYGVNANGSYLRLPDGTMLCWWKYDVYDQAVNSPYVGLYSGTRTWTFPAQFSAPPVAMGEMRWGTGASWCATMDTTQSAATFAIIDAVTRPTGTKTSLWFFAIGRWMA